MAFLEELGRKLRTMLRSGEAELIDDWLASQRGQGRKCYTHSLEISFPMTHPKAQEAYQKLIEGIGAAFAGATVIEGKGYWCPEEPCTADRMEIEDVKVIKVWHHCTDEEDRAKFARALKEAEEMTEQSTIAIAGTERFHLIDREYLRLPSE